LDSWFDVLLLLIVEKHPILQKDERMLSLARAVSLLSKILCKISGIETIIGPNATP
jgi:hypothetical protein